VLVLLWISLRTRTKDEDERESCKTEASRSSSPRLRLNGGFHAEQMLPSGLVLAPGSRVDARPAIRQFAPVLIAFHKPYGVLSQFTPDGSANRPLADFGFPPNVYPIGRLDADSEGLLLLSDEPGWNERLLHPRHGHPRTYWVQVERVPSVEALQRLSRGVWLGGHMTLRARVWMLDPAPTVPPRVPPIRFRKSVPACWIGLELFEGKNRQVRRMTAAIGHPTLRLIRVQIGRLPLGELVPGAWRELSAQERRLARERGWDIQRQNSTPCPPYTPHRQPEVP
jgi:23S rRNA pseudouridine2457 synthase